MGKCKSIETSNTSKITKTLLLSSVAIMAGAVFAPIQALADPVPTNSWDYNTVLDGNVSKDVSTAGLTNITVSGGNGYVEGNADIYTGHTVNVSGDGGATFAYKDNRDNIESTLNGNLNSNMKLVIIDRDGLFFSEGSVINVQSIVATTGDVSVVDAMDGDDLTIRNLENSGSIIQNGKITIQESGLAALVAPQVVNNGIIDAKLASVNLGAGETATLDLYGDGLLELAVEGELSDALITNAGQIESEGGLVQITAKAAKDTLDNIVNNSGIITVSSASIEGGKIILSGGDHGTIKNAGKIEGGTVNISGERFVQKEKLVTPLVPVPSIKPNIQSNGDDINISASGDVIISDGEIDAQGGDVTIDNDGKFLSIAEAIKTSASGAITLTQNEGGEIQNTIDALDNTGTGANTINVGAGIFAETVHIDEDNTTLNGANAGISYDGVRGFETVIKPDADSVGIYITADNAAVDGLLVEGGTSGVLANGADNALITNNIIRNQYHFSGEGDSEGEYAAGDGVFIQNANGVTVNDNLIGGMNDDGIEAVDVENFTASDNFIMDDGVNGDEGIAISNSLKVLVENNKILGARRNGIKLSFVVGSYRDGSDVLGGASVKDNYIVGSGRSGISLVNGNNSFSVDNNIIGNTLYGIEIVDTDRVLVGDLSNGNDNSGNFIHNVVIGVNVSGGRDISIIDNEILYASIGVQASEVRDYLAITQSNIDALDKGIYLKGIDGGNVNIAVNEVKAVNEGVFLDGGVWNGLDWENGNENLNIFKNSLITGSDAIRIQGDLDKGTISIDLNYIYSGRFGVSIQNEDGSGDIVASITNNKTDYTKDVAIKTYEIDYVTVLDNYIRNSESLGVMVDIFTNAKISGNIVDTTGHYGVFLNQGGLADVSGNIINNTSASSLMLLGVDYASIDGNFIYDSGLDAIYVRNSQSSEVGNNFIYNPNGQGIFIERGGETEVSNNIVHKAGHAIYVSELDSATVLENQIYDANGYGVRLDNIDSLALVESNQIYKTGWDGIFLAISQGKIYARNNTIDQSNYVDSSFSGIYVGKNQETEIKNNYISNTVTGITLSNSKKIEVIENIIHDVSTGILAKDSNILIDTNEINSSEYGIKVVNGYYDTVGVTNDFSIKNNIISSGDRAIWFVDSKSDQINLGVEENKISSGSNGIYIDGEIKNSSHINISQNDFVSDGSSIFFRKVIKDTAISVTGNSIVSSVFGIHFDGGLDGGKATVDGNTIEAGEEGVLLDGVFTNNAELEVSKNDITSGASAIRIEGQLDSGLITASQNKIYESGYGISISNDQSGYGNFAATIALNDIQNIENIGIFAGGLADVKILNNYIRDTGDRGVAVYESFDVDISGNVVDSADEEGIFLFYDNIADVSGNIIYNSKRDGISGKEINYFDISGNVIDKSGDTGVDIYDSDFVSIRDNKISNSEGGGVGVSGSGQAYILNNDIETSGGDGIWAVGIWEFVHVEDNIISYSGVYANGTPGVIYGSGYGIAIDPWEDADVLIEGNNVAYSNRDGIFVENRWGGTFIQDNAIYHSFENGIGVYYSDNVDILRNTIAMTEGDAIRLQNVSNVTMEDNIIEN